MRRKAATIDGIQHDCRKSSRLVTAPLVLSATRDSLPSRRCRLSRPQIHNTYNFKLPMQRPTCVASTTLQGRQGQPGPHKLLDPKVAQVMLNPLPDVLARLIGGSGDESRIPAFPERSWMQIFLLPMPRKAESAGRASRVPLGSDGSTASASRGTVRTQPSTDGVQAVLRAASAEPCCPCKLAVLSYIELMRRGPKSVLPLLCSL